MYLDKLQQDEVFVPSEVRPLRELTKMEPRKGLENVIVSNGKIVNIVSKSYGHIPNELFFAKAEQMLINAKLTYHRQTINRSDRSFSMDFILSDSTQFSVGNKADTILPLLRFTNSYDGSERTSGHFGFYRMVCSNGLHVVKSEIAFSIKHSTNGVNLIMPELEGLFRRFLDNEFYTISGSFGRMMAVWPWNLWIPINSSGKCWNVPNSSALSAVIRTMRRPKRPAKSWTSCTTSP